MFEPPPPRRACRVLAYRVRMQGADQWRRNRRAARRRGRAARKRQETARRFMHQSGNRPHHGAPGMSCMEACARRTSGFRRQSDRRRTPARNACELRGRPRHRVRTAASRVRGGGKEERRARGCACQQARVRQASRRTRDAARRGETPHGGRRSATERNDRNRNAAPTAAPECSIRAPPPAARRTRRARAPRSDSDRIRRARAPRRSRSGCAPTGTSRCRRSYRRRP
ncbi:hypothetical protein X995_2512 [Burkholderia pseudomallei B03]|nr:hypothetical protein X995_2512 [Burkholderia pseudomallei B03]AIV94667.1 hypothetical protein X996_2462 [Burkholderia pseudomallei A79A]